MLFSKGRISCTYLAEIEKTTLKENTRRIKKKKKESQERKKQNKGGGGAQEVRRAPDRKIFKKDVKQTKIRIIRTKIITCN